MTRSLQRLITYIPLEKDFHAIDIANVLYPNAVMYDTEGRQHNRALPTITRQLRTLKGVLEVRTCIFWAVCNFTDLNQYTTNEYPTNT